MSKSSPTIIPQRHDGKAWHICAEHRATGWLVVRANGRTVARFASKATAKAAVEREKRISQPPKDRKKLLPLYRSLSKNDYLDLKLKGH